MLPRVLLPRVLNLVVVVESVELLLYYLLFSQIGVTTGRPLLSVVRAGCEDDLAAWLCYAGFTSVDLTL